MPDARCGAPIWVPERRNKKGALGEEVQNKEDRQEISNYENDGAETDSRGMYS